VRDTLGTLLPGLSPVSIEMLAAALEFDPARRPRAAGLFARPLVNDLRSGHSSQSPG
jgi:hypothetical protein